MAPDSELGYPEGDASPTANRDLARLVSAAHRKGIRFFSDMVMAFAHEEPCSHIDFPDFCIEFDPNNPPNDPDALTSARADGSQAGRNPYGSTLWRYEKSVTTYDPISGNVGPIFPARQLMLTALTRWMRDFRVDGLRLDSVENVACWDFVLAYKDLGHAAFQQRYTDAGLNPANGADDRFLVVGEELSLPSGLITQNRLDGLWDDFFLFRVRAAIFGEGAENDNFEWTVRKMIDCRQFSFFTKGTQAINYITKHDVEGNERLFTMLQRRFPAGEIDQIEKRTKLAWACLMTAVGIPMFLAGEEFADQHDFFDIHGQVTQNGGKQINPVNYSRLTATPVDLTTDNLNNNPDGYYAAMRNRIFTYVKRLIQLRTTAAALAVDDTDFLWTDFNDGKQVVVWRRGGVGSAAQPPIIVVANFSDYYSPNGAQYVIPTWPGAAPAGMVWVEVSQSTPPRVVDPNLAGKEGIFPWEAKIYTYANA